MCSSDLFTRRRRAGLCHPDRAATSRRARPRPRRRCWSGPRPPRDAGRPRRLQANRHDPGAAARAAGAVGGRAGKPDGPAHRRIPGWRSTRATGIGIITIGVAGADPCPGVRFARSADPPTRGEGLDRIRNEFDQGPSGGSSSSDLGVVASLRAKRLGFLCACGSLWLNDDPGWLIEPALPSDHSSA